MAGAPNVQGASAWEKPIVPGVVYRVEIDPTLPRTLHAIRFSPSNPALRWQTDLGKGTMDEEGTKGRETPSKMLARNNALVAINGDFFSYDHGSPIGLTVRNGELLNTPLRSRAVFAWGPQGTAVGMGSSKASMVVAPASREFPIDGMNQPIGENGFGLYTPAQGLLRPRAGATVVYLDAPNVTWSPSTAVNVTVSAISTDTTPFKVPTGTVVLVASGTKKSRIAGLTVGTSVSLRLDTPGFDWEKIDNVIGGGPFLIRDKEVAIDGTEEGFDDAFVNKRHPRSAIGRTDEGDIWLVAIEGRQPHTIGATLPETASVMRRLGCIDAINLDGGGSTSLVVLGLPVARYSDATEREVSNGIVLFGPKAPEPEGKLRLAVDTKIGPDGRFSARVDRAGKRILDMDILWSSRGAAVVDPSGQAKFSTEGAGTILARVYGQTLTADVIWKKKG